MAIFVREPIRTSDSSFERARRAESNEMNYVENILSNPVLNQPHQFDSCIEDAIDWAQSAGLIIRTKEHADKSDVCQIAPFALLPSPFPRQLFDQAMSIQEAMNLLYFKISWDCDFLVNAHKDVIKSDNFTREMIQILQKIYAEGIKQKITLLTQRADYMCHVDDLEKSRKFQLKQIEVNNIAVSMGGLAQRATLLHRRVLNKLGKGVAAKCQQTIPDNEPIKTLAQGIHKAWQIFADKNAITLVVIGDVNQNQFDQRYIEYELEELSFGQMQIERLTLTQCAERLKLDENYALKLNEKPIAVVYFRAGYSPEDYYTSKEWEARLKMERSTAIKCPWIGLQLANTKKVQQVLSIPGVLEKFFDSDQKEIVSSVLKTFALMWGLERDDEQTLAIIKDAIANPYKYVLKPQLEGGGGNYFGQEVADKLKEFSSEQRASHILMQKITPLVVKNYLVRALQKPELKNVVSELGIYGYLIGDGENMMVKCNQTGGHILRSKFEHETKGGVAIGAAVIDTPFLV